MKTQAEEHSWEYRYFAHSDRQAGALLFPYGGKVMSTSLITSQNTSRCVGLLLIAVLALAAALAPVLPARAQDEGRCVPTPTGDYCPAGVACAFPLQVDYSDMQLNYREFYDKDGNFQGMMLVGKGFVVTLTNLASGATLSQEVKGTSFRDILNPDGTETIASSGNFFMIMYPTDIPPGPSALMYTGHVELRMDAGGVSTISHLSGQSTDMCAALSN